MSDRARMIDLVERAIDADPVCPTCRAPTEVDDEDGALVLRCSAAATATGVLARFEVAMFPHLRVLLLDSDELLAA